VALFAALPRMRERRRLRGRERELDQRRDQVVTAHRAEATERERRAEVAEQRARVAQQEAERERAAAQMREEQATMHERGLADHELVGEDERDHFRGTSAVPENQERVGETDRVGETEPVREDAAMREEQPGAVRDPQR